MAIVNVLLFLLVIKLPLIPLFPDKALSMGYDLTAPDTEIILPDILREVSGVTIIDTETLAFIQDERGVIYIFNTRENRIKFQIVFGEKGDYEDLVLVNNDIYILRSDATLFRISGFMSADFKVTRLRTGIPAVDNEGLCYDRDNDRLLIGCKSDIKTDNLKNRRAIYSFDLKTMSLHTNPVYILDPKNINKESVNYSDNSDKGKKDKKKEPELRTSAIGINPKTGKLFLISAKDHILCVINKDGTFGEIADLDKDLFQQAEGIAFYPDGDMLITNEAGNKKPTLLRFNYRGDR